MKEYGRQSLSCFLLSVLLPLWGPLWKLTWGITTDTAQCNKYALMWGSVIGVFSMSSWPCFAFSHNWTGYSRVCWSLACTHPEEAMISSPIKIVLRAQFIVCPFIRYQSMRQTSWRPVSQVILELLRTDPFFLVLYFNTGTAIRAIDFSIKKGGQRLRDRRFWHVWIR